MPVVRVLSWNIYHFSTSRSGAAPIAQAHRHNIILDEVHPAAAPRRYDLFVIIETQTAKPAAYANVGNLATSGPTGGIPATQQLLAALQARQAAVVGGAGGAGNWEAVLPTFLTAKTQTEAISVFYHTACLTLTGPLNDPAVGPGSPWHTPATAFPGGSTRKGQTRFYNPPLNEILFPVNPQRRPYMVDFTVAGAVPVPFSLVAHHSPPPSNAANNSVAQRGTLQLAQIQEITVARNPVNRPVIIVGDFNCCTVPGCPNGCSVHDAHAQSLLTGNGAVNYAHSQHALKVIQEAIHTTTHAEAAAAHSSAAAANPANVAAVTLAATNASNAAIAARDALARARQAHTLVVGAANILVNNAIAAEANITAALLPPPGAAPALFVASAANFALLATAARNVALAMNDHYNAGTTVFLQNYSSAVRHCANAIDNPAGSAVHAVATGNAALAAMNDINAASVPNAPGNALVPVPVPNAGPLIAAATAPGGPVTLAQAAAANGPGDVTLAKNARDSIVPVAQALFVSHIHESRSSLKGSAALPANYRNHAFDHILTLGANRVENAEVVDLVPAVISAYHMLFNAAMPAASFKAGFKYIAIWGKKGISDHLPIRADVDV